MGSENKTEFDVSETGALIDFLYVDKNRVDSLISQLRNGTLRSVTKTIGTSEGSSVSGEAGIPELAKGKVAHNLNSEDQAAEQYDPYHSQLISLINDLAVMPLTSLPESCSSKLVLLNSELSIRDTASIKAIMPVIADNSSLFGAQVNAQARKMIKLGEKVIKVLPDSIGLNIRFNDVNIGGTLKNNGLSISQSDLLRTYGVDLPGHWYTLGILDTIVDSYQTSPINSMENVIDSYAKMVTTLYSSSKYKIIPILIFRVINS